MTGQLHLIAASAEDVPVLSALLQDAAVRAVDIGYDAGARRFALLVSRYRWESGARTRVRSGLSIAGVLRVQRRNWPGGAEAVLDLLAITVDADALEIAFAGGTSLRLSVEAIDMLLDDVTGPWGVASTPAHA